MLKEYYEGKEYCEYNEFKNFNAIEYAKVNENSTFDENKDFSETKDDIKKEKNSHQKKEDKNEKNNDNSNHDTNSSTNSFSSSSASASSAASTAGTIASTAAIAVSAVASVVVLSPSMFATEPTITLNESNMNIGSTFLDYDFTIKGLNSEQTYYVSLEGTSDIRQIEEEGKYDGSFQGLNPHQKYSMIIYSTGDDTLTLSDKIIHYTYTFTTESAEVSLNKDKFAIGSTYIKYSFNIANLDEGLDYALVIEETNMRYSVSSEGGLYEGTFDGLNPNEKYTLSLISSELIENETEDIIVPTGKIKYMNSSDTERITTFYSYKFTTLKTQINIEISNFETYTNQNIVYASFTSDEEDYSNFAVDIYYYQDDTLLTISNMTMIDGVYYDANNVPETANQYFIRIKYQDETVFSSDKYSYVVKAYIDNFASYIEKEIIYASFDIYDGDYNDVNVSILYYDDDTLLHTISLELIDNIYSSSDIQEDSNKYEIVITNDYDETIYTSDKYYITRDFPLEFEVPLLESFIIDYNDIKIPSDFVASGEYQVVAHLINNDEIDIMQANLIDGYFSFENVSVSEGLKVRFDEVRIKNDEVIHTYETYLSNEIGVTYPEETSYMVTKSSSDALIATMNIDGNLDGNKLSNIGEDLNGNSFRMVSQLYAYDSTTNSDVAVGDPVSEDFLKTEANAFQSEIAISEQTGNVTIKSQIYYYSAIEQDYVELESQEQEYYLNDDVTSVISYATETEDNHQCDGYADITFTNSFVRDYMDNYDGTESNRYHLAIDFTFDDDSFYDESENYDSSIISLEKDYPIDEETTIAKVPLSNGTNIISYHIEDYYGRQISDTETYEIDYDASVVSTSNTFDDTALSRIVFTYESSANTFNAYVPLRYGELDSEITSEIIFESPSLGNSLTYDVAENIETNVNENVLSITSLPYATDYKVTFVQYKESNSQKYYCAKQEYDFGDSIYSTGITKTTDGTNTYYDPNFYVESFTMTFDGTTYTGETDSNNNIIVTTPASVDTLNQSVEVSGTGNILTSDNTFDNFFVVVDSSGNKTTYSFNDLISGDVTLDDDTMLFVLYSGDIAWSYSQTYLITI